MQKSYVLFDVTPANNILLQQRFHNVEGNLWKRCQITLLKRNPWKLHERCRKALYLHNIYGNINFWLQTVLVD